MRNTLIFLLVIISFQEICFSQCPAPIVPPLDLINVVANSGFESGVISPSSPGPHTLVGCCSFPGTYMIGGLSNNFNGGMIAGIIPHSGTQMLMIDAVMASNATAWEQTVSVQPNKNYYFSAWLTALSSTEKSQMIFQVQPVAPVAGPAVNISAAFIPPDGPDWEQYFGTWFSGSTTSVTIRLINSNPLAVGGNGNDYAIDDIVFRPTCVGVNAGPKPEFGATTLGLCNMGGSADLNSNVSDNVNHTYTWFQNSIMVANPITPDILENQITTGNYVVCLDSSGCVQSDTVTLVSPLTLDLGPDLNLCNPSFKLLDTRITVPASFTIKWYKNNLLIPSQTYPSYLATGAGTYRVEVTDGASCNGSDEIVITSQVDETIGDFICISSGDISATVSVIDAGGTYQWYDNSVGGTLLGSGLTYTNPALTGPTIYYVENTKWVTSGSGLPDASSSYLASSSNSGNNVHGQNFMNFTAEKDAKIDFVTVQLNFPGNASDNVTITLEDKTVSGTTTATYPVSNSAGPGNYYFIIPINMNIISGHNYWFSITGVNGLFYTLRYADGVINTYFPITYQAITLLGGQANTVYPALFNWQFSHPSSCARTPAAVTSSCALPVNWLLINADLKEGKVILNWITENETNNSFFEIQRSVNGHLFNSIGKMNGQGSTSNSKSYSFIDYSSQPGISYYRIAQYDIDGKVSYSKMISIANMDLNIKISPNPSNAYFIINAPMDTKIKVMDLFGRLILSDIILSDNYRFGATFNSGSYIISLINGGNEYYSIIIKE